MMLTRCPHILSLVDEIVQRFAKVNAVLIQIGISSENALRIEIGFAMHTQPDLPCLDVRVQ